MKLVMAVISNKDVSKVLDAITKEGFASTRISTTGQFLADGHTTLYVMGSKPEMWNFEMNRCQ